MPDIYQVSHLRREVTLGRDGSALVTFTPCRRLFDRLRGVLLEGSFEHASYGLVLPAPWNGSKWRLAQGGHEVATAENLRNVAGPLKVKRPADFDVSYQGRVLRLETIDPDKTGPGRYYRLSEGGVTCGGLEPRAFDRDSPWHADLEVPGGLPVPVAAFLAWLAREGGAKVRHSRHRP